MLEGDSPRVTMEVCDQNREFIEMVKKKLESEEIKVQLLNETEGKA